MCTVPLAHCAPLSPPTNKEPQCGCFWHLPIYQIVPRTQPPPTKWNLFWMFSHFGASWIWLLLVELFGSNTCLAFELPNCQGLGIIFNPSHVCTHSPISSWYSCFDSSLLGASFSFLISVHASESLGLWSLAFSWKNSCCSCYTLVCVMKRAQIWWW